MESLPLDIKRIIAAFTGDATKRQLRLASSNWFKIVDYRNFTLYFTKDPEWKQIVDRFEKYQAPISLTLKKCQIKDSSVIIEHITRLNNLELFDARSVRGFHDVHKLAALNLKRLNISVPDIMIWKLFTRLEVLDHDKDISMADLTELLANLTNLQELNFTIREPANPFLLIKVRSKLTSLVVRAPSILSDLQHLNNLKKLSFWLSDQPEPYPTLSLKHLTALESIDTDCQLCDLTSTRLTAIHFNRTLTPFDKQQFASMSAVKYVDLLEVEEHMEYLTALTSLSHLSLCSYNERYWEESSTRQKYSILGNIRSSQLTYLAAHRLGETVDFGYWTQLDSIRVLNLADTPCDDSITKLTNLEELELMLILEKRDESSFLTSLSKLTKLRALRYYPITRRAVTVDLTPLTNLESLVLGLYTTFIGFESLTRLTHLRIFRCNQDQEFPFLGTLARLKSLDTDCNISINPVTALTGLQKLILKKCASNDALDALTSSLQHLTHLYVAYCTSGLDMLLLTRLTKLQQLRWPQLTSDDVGVLKETLPDLLGFD